MSLFGAMRTSVSGMAAFSNRLSAVADNIGNSSTTGYKQASIEFATVLGESAVQNFSSGGVASHLRYDVGAQGALQQTARVTDLAVLGSGFFVVSNNDGAPYLTRAGAFVPDANGYLVNTAGYRLMGYDLSAGAPSGNGADGLSAINLNQNALVANPSSSGRFAANLPANAAVTPAANLPSANAAGSAYAAKSSLTAYDNLGNKVVLDIYFAKTASNAWEMTVYDQAGASSGGFPYAGGPLATAALAFDPTSGKSNGAGSLTIPVPNGQSVDLDLRNMTPLATDYTVVDAQMNGSAPSLIDHVEIGDDGTVSAVYQNGARIDTYRIPLAEVASPANLLSKDGNVFAESPGSGSINVGTALKGGLGRIVSGALESSTVDLASELTTMIEAQRGYGANSKVFQTGSEMLDMLLNLKG
jgi:flagellar hook protein FlgE